MISRMQLPQEMYGKGGLTSLREARTVLERHAPMGEFLAYINSDEAALLKSRGGSGEVANESGIKSYGLLKKITKPFAKVLDKIVPNEIKPALPFIAAAVPFLAPALLPGLTAMQYAAISAGANAASQLSQEGAAERGLNPISVGLSALSGYGAAPGSGVGTSFQPSGLQEASTLRTFAAPSTELLSGIDDIGQLGYTASQTATGPLTFTDKLQNLGASALEGGARTLGEGTKSFESLIGPGEFTSKQALALGKAYVPGALQASGELAYNAALDAQKAYTNNEMLAMGNLASANKQDQINYIRRAMVSAGFNENEISSAISRSGFAGGGRVAYGMGSLVKPAMRGLKSMKNKIVDFISKMTDDIEIRTQTDYADDSGASFDIYITPKTERGKNTLDQINQMGLAEKISDGRYFINDINLEEATMSLNERGIKASGVYEPTAKGEQFESFRTAGQGPYGADYYGYDRLKEGLQGPKRPPMDQVDYDTIPSPTDKPEGFADGGLMNLRMGGMPAEMDLRKGGFVPLGVKEKADDVPARLSKNEFVFTAKAVRNAGGGDVRKGAKRMYQVMNQLEARA
jgi:hypothetical protein